MSLCMYNITWVKNDPSVCAYVTTDVDDALPSPVTDDLDPDAFSSAFASSTSINHYSHASSTVASSPGVGGHLHGDHTHVRTYPTIAEVEEEIDGADGEGEGEGEGEGRGDIINSLTVTLSLPEHSRGRGIQPSQRRTDDQRVLVFHGIILRSQLVTLLQNKIFFSEGDGVRMIWVGVSWE